MRTSERQQIAQRIVESPGEMAVFDEFNQRHPRKSLRFNLTPDSSLQDIANELRSTVHNFTLESMLHAAILSAIQVDREARMIGITERFMEDRSVPDIRSRESQLLAPHPFPRIMHEYIERLTSILVEAARGTGCTAESLTYTRVRMNILHTRAREIHEYLQQREYNEIPSVPSRISLYNPVDASLFTSEERQAVLTDRMKPGYIVQRLHESDALEPGIQIDQEFNGALTAAVIYAGSYAIEEKHPGISPRDTTRLLLFNADILGATTRPRLNDCLYNFVVPPNVEECGSFHELARMATKDQKMILGNDDRLRVPLHRKSYGLCPMSFSYTLSDSKACYFRDFNENIGQLYGVVMPEIKDNVLVVATELLILGALYGEPLVNGRAVQLTREFFRGNLGKRATSRYIVPPC